MTEKPPICAICHGPLPTPAVTGRPATYCGVACRRMREYAIKRLDRHIARLEWEESWSRLDGTLGGQQRAKRAAKEIVRAQERLRLILGAGDEMKL